MVGSRKEVHHPLEMKPPSTTLEERRDKDMILSPFASEEPKSPASKITKQEEREI